MGHADESCDVDEIVLFSLFPLSLSARVPANTKHLYNICTMLDQRRRRWADVVQMLYKCFMFVGVVTSHGDSIATRRVDFVTESP